MKHLVLTIASLIWTFLVEINGNSINSTSKDRQLLAVSKDHSDFRIIGGEHARAGQFPFAAYIRAATSDSTFYCGGALVSNLYLLTAAQCVENATLLIVTLGSNRLTENDSNTLILSTSKYYQHPEFNRTTLENDIAVVEFQAHIQYNDYIGKIYLPITPYRENLIVTSIGWGQTSDSIQGPDDYLNFVQMITISNEECQLYYGSQVTETMICVVGQSTEGVCSGDSGSPLIYYLNSRHPIFIGVTSFRSGVGCESFEPSGYTRIFPYKDWILNITGNIDYRFSLEMF